MYVGCELCWGRRGAEPAGRGRGRGRGGRGESGLLGEKNKRRISMTGSCFASRSWGVGLRIIFSILRGEGGGSIYNVSLWGM